jgi:hypothetical protein
MLGAVTREPLQRPAEADDWHVEILDRRRARRSFVVGSHRIPAPTRSHVSCRAPSAAAFGPGTRQSAVSACQLRE